MAVFFRNRRTSVPFESTKKPVTMKKNGTATRAMTRVKMKSAVCEYVVSGEVCMAITRNAATTRNISMPL